MSRDRRRIRCAIYTRKSTDEGLEQDFNSLDAQREACEAYIASQKAEGWELVPERFDDGGISGGTLERPALQRLLAAIDARQIEQIVVYKIDRLTRSLNDFSKIVERLDLVNASFVSVTQSFNTATSMGRLTLNMLLSFAQFEREVTAERIRDKIAASKKKGLWMGGTVPLGYLPEGRSLKIDPETAPVIRRLVALYQENRSLSQVTTIARAEGLSSRRVVDPATRQVRGGRPLSRGHIHQILTNPIYAGSIRHKTAIYPGQHRPLIEPSEWDALQELLSKYAARRRGTRNAGTRAPLCGKIIDANGNGLTPTHTTKNGKRLRYYISRCLVTGNVAEHPEAWRLPAIALEDRVADLVIGQLGTPRIVASLSKQNTASTVSNLAKTIETAITTLLSQPRECVLDLVTLVRLAAGQITITLDRGKVGRALKIDPQLLPDALLRCAKGMTLKRRGVETRLIIGGEGTDLDVILLRNIQQAREWYQYILEGKSFSDVMAASQTSPSRFRKLMQLAFLAPDLLTRVTNGTQPIVFTSEWVKTHSLPADWDAQRRLFDTL